MQLAWAGSLAVTQQICFRADGVHLAPLALGNWSCLGKRIALQLNRRKNDVWKTEAPPKRIRSMKVGRKGVQAVM